MTDTDQLQDTEIKATFLPPKLEISSSDFDALSWGDPHGDFPKEWMRLNNITPGSEVVLSVVDKDGTVREKKITTNPQDFFTTIRDVDQSIPYVEDEDDPLGDLEQAQIVPEGNYQELRTSKIDEEYSDTRTLEMDQLSSDQEVAAIVEKARSDDALESVKTLIEKPEFQPTVGLHIGDIEVAFSPVFLSQKRKYVVAYVRDQTEGGDNIKPRLFYESNSDGGWRATPGFYEDGVISKGDFLGEEYGQYVQVTKPVEPIAAMLDGLGRQEVQNKDVSRSDLESIFTVDRPYQEEGRQFETEVEFAMIGGHGLEAFVPGLGYKKHGEVEGRRMLENMQLPEGFEPDFNTEPSRRYAINHTLLGKSGVDVFNGEYGDRKVEWHVAHDKSGRIWIERLMFADTPTTNYGTTKEVILAGALNTKPVEYASHLTGEPNVDYDRFDKSYVDLGKTIDRMPWAKRYRDATGI